MRQVGIWGVERNPTVQVWFSVFCLPSQRGVGVVSQGQVVYIANESPYLLSDYECADLIDSAGNACRTNYDVTRAILAGVALAIASRVE